MRANLGHNYWRRLALALLLLVCGGAAWWLYEKGLLKPALFEKLLTHDPISCVVLFILAYALSVLTLIPTLPLNLAAGIFWGAIGGALTAIAGAVMGTIGAFYLARELCGQPFARSFDSSLVSRLQREFDGKGWRFVAFIRLNPVLPTGPLNYLLGLTSIDALTYMWSTAVFLVPPTFAVALIGHEMGTFMDHGALHNLIQSLIVASGTVVVLVVMWYITRDTVR